MSRFVRSIALLGAAALVPAVAVAQSTPVSVSGVLYAQYMYLLEDAPDGSHGNNFDVTRAYLNFIGKFSDEVGGRVTADIYRNADGSLGYRLKYGYAHWTPRKFPVTLKAGLIQTPFVAYNEDLWDYRVQGPEPTDRAGYLTAADFGVAAEGTWKDNGVTMSGGIYNGEGFRNEPGDQHKDVAARLSVRLSKTNDDSRFGGLRVTGFALTGTPTGGGTRERLLGQVSYRTQQFLLAGLYLAGKDNLDTAAVALPDRESELFAAYGWYKFSNSKFGLFARYDHHDPDKDLDADAYEIIIGGLSYQVNENLRLLGGIDHITYENDFDDPERSKLLLQLQLNF